MAVEVEQETQAKPYAHLGVPLGGVGSGSIEFGSDAWLRNISINNNRVGQSAVSVSPLSFFALSVLDAERKPLYAKLLQGETSTETQLPDAPSRVKWKEITFRGLYPTVRYKLEEPGCPVHVSWSAFSPVIPFDHTSSIMPMVCMRVQVANLSDETRSVSVLFNLENMVGRTSTTKPDSLAVITPGSVLERESFAMVETKGGRTVRVAKNDGNTNAVFFGEATEAQKGQYCVVARLKDDIDVSWGGWNPGSGESSKAFWDAFTETGSLDRLDMTTNRYETGAICSQVVLEPQQSQRFDFLLCWHSPHFFIGEHDQGNGYCNEFKDVMSVAKNGVKHFDYYYKAVGLWQNRLLSSSLPRWLCRILLNNTSVLTTNSFYTKDGRFGMLESPEGDYLSRLDQHLYTSLGVLLFLPRFEETEMTLFEGATNTSDANTLCRGFVKNDFQHPDFDGARANMVEFTCNFVLSAYRNYMMTGKLPKIQYLFPRIQKLMDRLLKTDKDGDGFPDPQEPWVTYDGIIVDGLCSYVCSLWLATLRAYSRLALRFNELEEARALEVVFRKASASFEVYFWDEYRGYYRLGHDPRRDWAQQDKSFNACHTAQLAGQWYSDFLGLGPLLEPVRLARAVDTIRQCNVHTSGMTSSMMPDGALIKNNLPDSPQPQGYFSWPLFTMAHFNSLQMYYGQSTRALQILEYFYNNLYRRTGTMHTQPLQWNLKYKQPGNNNLEHHSSALSMWYLVYALQGFMLNVADQRVRVMPNLPEGKFELDTPIFSPVTLGWLKFWESREGAYAQRVQLIFDSPQILKGIDLRVPASVQTISVGCETSEGTAKINWRLVPFHHGYRVSIDFMEIATATSSLTIQIQQGKVSFIPPPISPGGGVPGEMEEEGLQ